MKIVYVATAGTSDATKSSMPIHFAVNGSVEVGHDVEIILAGDGAEILIGDNSETMEGVGIPPMRELLSQVKKHSIPVYV